ncbi:MAG: hypothetical protein IKW15_06035, partial [Bacteroidales bacterium]|nr:hypothetical protein [Bacteroidales bacterium]
GNGNTDWRRWVDSSPREAPLMQAVLKKAQEEAKENGGYISDETYGKLEAMIAEATSSNKDAVEYLYSAMVGESNSKKLINFGKDTYLGKKDIQRGVVYGIDTVEKLFNEVPKVDGDIQQLADKVFSICKGLGIGVVFTNNKFGRRVIGYSSNRNVIRYKASYLNGDASSEKKKALYLHEAIHAVTAYALREENYSGLPMNMREAVDELNAIYKDLKKKGLLKGWYGGTNVREMVAELANPAFRSYLKSIKAFKDVINAVAKFFVGTEVLGSSNTDALEQTSAALNKLLDLFNKELYENYNKSTGLYEAQDEGSIDTMYESVGLRYEKGANGETIIKDADGNVVDEITEDMINESPLGVSLVDAVKSGMITEEDRKKQLEFFKGLFNLQLRTNDLDLVYAVSGAIGFQPVEPGPRDMSKSDVNGKKQPFAALTSNADKQYSTTIDFTTICKKTQAVINNMSSIMVKLGRGLTKEEIVDIVFKNTHKAGEPVPCPVCYVFSRWVGLGGLFDNIKKLQEKYKDADVDALRKEINILNEKVDNIAKARGMKRTKAKDELRKSIQKELSSLRLKEEKGEKLTRKEKNVAKMLEEQLFQIDNLTWLTDVRLGEGYKPVPD